LTAHITAKQGCMSSPDYALPFESVEISFVIFFLVRLSIFLVTSDYPDCMRAESPVQRGLVRTVFKRGIVRTVSKENLQLNFSVIVSCSWASPPPATKWHQGEWAHFPHAGGDSLRTSNFPVGVCFPGFLTPDNQTKSKALFGSSRPRRDRSPIPSNSNPCGSAHQGLIPAQLDLRIRLCSVGISARPNPLQYCPFHWEKNNRHPPRG
jgi:hypothetical protein